MRGAVAGTLVAVALSALPGSVAAQEAWPPADCPVATAGWTPPVGVVGCVSIDSAAIGGPTPIRFHVPPSCATGPCAVVYNLHGFGGDHDSQLGTSDAPSAWVSAIGQGPAEDPGDSAEPWTLADPSTWVPLPELPLIQVTTYGRTVPDGFGPQAGLESFYSDWNPRFAEGGDDERYATPPPRFETFLTDELLPFVEATFPTIGDRAHRAITGVSLGGFGSFKYGLAHPDLFAAVGSVSGAHNFLFAPSGDFSGSPDASGAFVADPGTVVIPSPTGGSSYPLGPGEGFTVPFVAYGDPAVDQPYFRGNMPVDLAQNGRAFDEGGGQVTFWRAIVNDAVPRRPEDVANPASYATAQGLEAMVLVMNNDMEVAWDTQGVEREFDVHPGLHSGVYWNPWLRQHLEDLAARLSPAVADHVPTSFDHRSIATDYDIWGWHVDIDRDTVEFLVLRDVTCDALTVQGTGLVTLTVPARCGTGFEVDGAVARSTTVDLGPGAPTVEPTGFNTGAATRTLALAPLPVQDADDGEPAVAEPGGSPTPLPATGGSHGPALAGLLTALGGLALGARRR